MSIKSSKIRNNISLLLTTTLLSGVVVSDVKAIDGGSYAAQLGLKKKLNDANDPKEKAEKDKAKEADENAKDDGASKKSDADQANLQEKSMPKKTSVKSASEDPRPLTSKEQKELAAFKKMPAEKRDQLSPDKLQKFEELKVIERRRYDHESKEEGHRESAKLRPELQKGELLPDETKKDLISGTNYSDKDLFRIPGAARNAAEEAMQQDKEREEADRQSMSKLAKLKDKVKSKSSAAAKNIKETASDTRKKLRLPGSIEEAKYNVKTNLSNLKKGTTKAATNVRDAAKSAHESISNKINPKISPEEVAEAAKSTGKSAAQVAGNEAGQVAGKTSGIVEEEAQQSSKLSRIGNFFKGFVK